MSVLHLEVCPICGAEYSLARQTTKSGGVSQISYVCSGCDSELLWLGDDLWLQGDRWAYQRIGREDRAYLLHTSLTVDELRQLANQAPASGDDAASSVSAWQASENGWEEVPAEEELPGEPAADLGAAAAMSDQDPWFAEPAMTPASEAEVSAEYEWLEAQPADPGRDTPAPAQDDWFEAPAAVLAAEMTMPPVEASDEPDDPWQEAFNAGSGGEEAALPGDEWAAPSAPAPATPAPAAIPGEEQWPAVAASTAQPSRPTRQRRSRGSPFLVVSVVLVMFCFLFSAAAMIVTTNMSGRPLRGGLPANLPTTAVIPAATPVPTAAPPATEPAPDQPLAIEFQSVSEYVAGTGSHYVVGEVINKTGENLHFVEILASFYDGSGQLLGTGSTFAELSIIEPGGVAPFRLETLDPLPSLADTRLRADYLTSDLPPLSLEVLSHNASIGENGWHYILGEIRNPHDFPIKFPEIVATYYNPSHQVVRVEVAFAESEVLQPGEVSLFKIELVDPPADLHHYVLQTESVRE